jgi:hypothetical protein
MLSDSRVTGAARGCASRERQDGILKQRLLWLCLDKVLPRGHLALRMLQSAPSSAQAPLDGGRVGVRKGAAPLLLSFANDHR